MTKKDIQFESYYDRIEMRPGDLTNLATAEFESYCGRTEMEIEREAYVAL